MVSGALATRRNHQRYSALLFGSVLAVSLGTHIVFISLKPQTRTTSKGNDTNYQVTQINNLIASCQYTFEGCHDNGNLFSTTRLTPNHQNLLLQYSTETNINPQVVLTLAVLTHQTNIDLIKSGIIDTNRIIPIFSELNRVKLSIAPNYRYKTYSHPTFGTFDVSQINLESFILTKYLGLYSSNKQSFTQSISPDSNQNFTAVFTAIFNTSPLE